MVVHVGCLLEQTAYVCGLGYANVRNGLGFVLVLGLALR